MLFGDGDKLDLGERFFLPAKLRREIATRIQDLFDIPDPLL